MRHPGRLLTVGIFFVLVSVFLLPHAGGKAAETGFSFTLDRAGAAAGDTVKLSVLAKGDAEKAAAFRLRVSYDGDVLRFLGTETTGPANGNLRTNSSSNPIYSVYVCSVSGGSAPKLSGKIVTFVFQVKNDAAAGNTRIGAQVDQIFDFDGDAMDIGNSGDFRLNVTSLSDEALLTGLVPSQGALQPAFSPNRTGYSLAVGTGVSSVTFEADASSGGTVKISRKSLGAAGSDTQIVVTVTSADKSVQKQYFVLVSRAAKPGPASGTQSAPVIKNSPPAVRQTAGRTTSKPAARTAAGGTKRSNAAQKSSGAPSSSERTAGSGASADVPEQETVVQTKQAAGPAPFEIVPNRMPTYFAGMLACAFCMSTGVAVFLWLSAKPKE